MNIESLSEYQAYFYNAQIIVTAVMVLICLFAFVNLLNTCITNTVIRRHDYARIYFVKAMYWKRTVVPVVSSFFRTLVCRLWHA